MQSLSSLWESKNYRIASVIALFSALWMLSGLVISSDSEEAEREVKADDKLTTVQVQRLKSEPYALQVRVRARTQAHRMVDVRAEVEGRVAQQPVVKGAQVKIGDTMCQIAMEDRQLRLDEAKASVQQAQLEYDGALRLKSGGYQSKTAIAGAKARLQTAKANLQRSELDLANLNIKAPFDGVVDLRPVELGDYMRKGDTCARVIDLDPLVLAGQVSETDVARLQVGSEAHAKLRTGEQVTGRIRYIGRESDTVTRTFPIEVEVPNAEGKLLAGITSKLVIPVGSVEAFHIPASLLTLDDDGQVGVRIVDETKVVQFYLVDIIGNDDNGVWVLGIPESSLLITVGQEYVAKGEKVAYQFAGGAKAEEQAASL
ncbi:efflux RND transporter periplasmic adaptor subunit [Pseudoteredinibacter isoporae]|uniref:efflux RND transporter periplasmic adaptor subunit n=1 Tax=Pseudoteredinibacter isoporae TaxID=570281 RepID=UPI00310490D7